MAVFQIGIKFKAQNFDLSLRVSKVKDKQPQVFSHFQKKTVCHEKFKCAPLQDMLIITPSAIKQNDFKCIVSFDVHTRTYLKSERIISKTVFLKCCNFKCNLHKLAKKNKYKLRSTQRYSLQSLKCVNIYHMIFNLLYTFIYLNDTKS